jgi:hypothetical protein
VALLGRAAGMHHRIKIDPSDVIIVSRPDIAFSMSIDAAALRNYSKRTSEKVQCSLNVP